MTRLSRISTVKAKDLNDKGVLFGGELLSEMDIIGGFTAMKHAQTEMFTVGVNFMRFIEPMHLNEVYLVEAFVSGVGQRSIETYCTVYRCDTYYHKETLVADAFYTYVPVDDVDIPDVYPENDSEKLIIDHYKTRRNLRKTPIGVTES